jgi:regulator of RNase E activity RraA
VTDAKVVGRAVTVRIVSPDSTLVHKSTELLSEGDVLVVDVGGDRRHAPVGEMVAYAARASGAVGIVVDGVCTDLPQFREMRFPIFARGASLLTTKLHGLDSGAINTPVSIGNVLVNPGDVVCADDNGVLVLSPSVAESVLEIARADDAGEIGMKARMDSGEKLPDLTSANEILRRLGPLYDTRS